ncbi:MAG: potassium-transporting ATPase subunit C, partial [Candidatus Omnitrophota bacterium]
MIREQLRIAVSIFILLTIITGIAYPSLVTGIAQIFFPREANGSIISYNGKTLGSSLIGQSFDDPKYMWGRLSATSPVPYIAASSSGSNLGPSNPMFLDAVKARRSAFRSADPYNK